MGLSYKTRKGHFGTTLESVGDETLGVFESRLSFLQGVSPKIITRSIDIPRSVLRLESQYSFVHLLRLPAELSAEVGRNQIIVVF